MKVIDKYREMPIAVKATLWFLIGNLICKGITIISTPIFTRLLSTEEYGKYSVYLSWQNIFAVFITMRLERGCFNKGLTKFKDHKDGYAYSMQVAVTIITMMAIGVCIVFSGVITKVTELSLIIIILICLEALFSESIAFWQVRERYDFKYRGVILISVLLAITNAGVGVFAVLTTNGNKGDARIISCIATQIVFGIVIYIINFNKGYKGFQWKYVSYGILFNLPLIPHYFSQYVLDSFDRIMISKMVGQAEVGIYGVAASVGNALKIVTTSISSAYIPLQYRSLDEKIFDNIKKQMTPLLYSVVLISLFFIAFAPEVISVFAPKDYHEAIYCIPPLTSSVLFVLFGALFGNIEMYYDKNIAMTVITCIAAGLNIILNYIFIPIFGFVAAAYTTMVSYAIYAVLHVIYSNYLTMKNDNNYVYDNNHLFITFVIMIGSSILFSFAYRNVWIRYCIIIVLVLITIFNRKKIICTMKTIKK